MNIYLNESYNVQRQSGKQFVSINGFCVLEDKILRKHWKEARKIYANKKRRIHATDSHFEVLRHKGIEILGKHNISIVSVFQIIQQIPPGKNFFRKDKIDFEKLYLELLKKLLLNLSLGEYRKVRIVIDARKHKGVLGKRGFQHEIKIFLEHVFPKTQHLFKESPSTSDVLVEMADFVSNTFFREYWNGSEHAFQKLGFRLIQIKNPL